MGESKGVSPEAVSVIVKTFERPRCLRRLLRSLERHAPGIEVLVADDSKEPYARGLAKRCRGIGVRVFEMPPDSGVSAGRNLLLGHVETPYFVHFDDDFIFDDRTDLAAARALLEEHELDILGGLYYDVAPLGWRDAVHDLVRGRTFRIRERILKRGVPRRFMGNFVERPDGTVGMEPVAWVPPVVRCDLVQNFFIARTEVVREKVGGWDERIKIGGDHEDFFFRASRAGVRIGHTEPFGVVHLPERPAHYARMRARAKEMRPARFRGWFDGA